MPMTRTRPSLPCDTAWISVVCLTGSSASSRPFESIKCEAKIVFINVDFPRPVCPMTQHSIQYLTMQIVKNEVSKRTNNNDIELETALQELVFYLLCDRIKTNVGRRTDLFNCRGHDTSKD